jgi:AcrR family transcriptional regulator
VETALLEVARELFDAKGFQATTTMEISRQADVSERLIFSKFGSKAGVFNAAVLEPFAEVVAAYLDAWLTDARGDTTPEERFDYLVSGLYDLARKHRKALITALAENINGESGQQHTFDKLAQTIQRMLLVPHDYTGLDVPALVGALVGMVFGAALLDDLIYPEGMRRPGRQRLIDEIRTMLIARTQYGA